MDTQKNKMVFLGYQVHDIDFQTNPSFAGEEIDLDVQPELNFEIVKSGKIGIVVIQCQVLGEEDSPFGLEVDIEGGFGIDNLPEEAVDDLLRYNAVAILYPYLRTVVANITMIAGFGALHLPVIDVRNLTKDVEVMTMES